MRSKSKIYLFILFTELIVISVVKFAEAGSSNYLYYYPVIDGKKDYVGVIYLNNSKCPGHNCGMPIFTMQQMNQELTFLYYSKEYLDYQPWVRYMKKQMSKLDSKENCPIYLRNFKFSEGIFKGTLSAVQEEARKRIGDKTPCEMLRILVNTNVWNGADYIGHIIQWTMYQEYIKSNKPIATYSVKVPAFENAKYEQHIQVDMITKKTKLLFDKPQRLIDGHPVISDTSKP